MIRENSHLNRKCPKNIPLNKSVGGRFSFFLIILLEKKRVEINQARELFEQVAELCLELGDKPLSLAIESSYKDFYRVNSPQEIFDILSDMMAFVDEIEPDDNEEILEEIESIYNFFQDELE